ncbi:MFS transporter [Penicillium crustosum]|uniref:MFS transporter n=1 Tax=Penicillium crustosum TaxID=36656 RepID=UPI00238CAB0D|nr:MFS transporter [Penicillium crustosum]KAJ5418635.1 MFS transporter [Penicillium crustosum]
MTSGTEQATLNTEENGSDSDHLSKEPIAMPALDWDGPTDSNNPRNFSTPKKVFITACLASLVCISTFGSSVMSPASGQLIHEFGISKELSILATALYVLGFAVGPLLFGPASEVLGRKYPLSVGVFLFAIFSIPIAVAKNVATIFVCRFLCGTFAAAPLAIAGGGLADLWEPLSRGIAVAGFASATFLGPVLGPLALTPIQWVALSLSHIWDGGGHNGCLSFSLSYFLPSISSSVLKHTAPSSSLDWQKREDKCPPGGKVDFKQLAKVYMLRPFIMLVQEPILALLTLYMGFIYGFLYLCFEAFPIAFEEHRGWNIGIGSLPFLSITVGVLIGVVIIIVHTMTRMRRKLETVGDAPEERLVPMMIGSILMPAGIFWFAWTSNTSLPWAPQVVSGVFIGCGILLIFLQGMNYIIDVYKVMANSAISINAMFRGLLGAGFPLFASYMFDNLGVPWAMSLLGFLCVALVPVPFLFFIYGERIRKWSKFTAH